MTQEQAKSKIRMSVTVDKDHIKSLEKADDVIDQIYNDHEAELKLASDVYSTDKMHMYQELKAKDKITQDIKEAYELKSIAYDLLLEVIKLKDEEIDRLKASVKQWRQNFLDA